VEDVDRFRLLGKYRTPRVRVGRFVRCLIRGEVEIVGFTSGPVPWPQGKTTRRPRSLSTPVWPNDVRSLGYAPRMPGRGGLCLLRRCTARRGHGQTSDA
jgi:hypothetical protein